MSKNRVAALGASAVSAALVGTALFAPTAVAAEAPASPSAYAVSASGIINIPKTPYAEGTQDPDAVVSIPGQPLLNVDVLDAMSEPGKAKAKVAGVSLLAGSIQAGVLTASCTNGKLNSDIANLKLAGTEIPVDTAANEVDIPAPLEGIIDIQINKQVTNDDGSKTVTALSIQLLKGIETLPVEDIPALGGVLDKLSGQTINLASATCAKTDGGDDTTPPDDGDDTTPPDDGDNGDNNNGGGDNGDHNGGADEADKDGTAPTPVPQPGHISVTG